MTRVGIASVLGALLALAGFLLLASTLSGDANFENLVEAHDKTGSVWTSGLVSFLGYLLLIAPLLFLFRAVVARSPKVRNQLIGVVILGPLLLAVSAICLSAGTLEAADTYVEGKAKPSLTSREANEKCKSDEQDEGAKDFAAEFEPKQGETAFEACEAKKTEEDTASNSIRDATFVSVGQFCGIGGTLALLIGLFYTCLWALRTGLLSRFWGSLGMAVGVAALIGFLPIVYLWFVYFGILLVGVIPGGRPPAWAAGEAIPLPSPGEKMAAEMEPKDPDAIDVDAVEDDESPPTNGNGNGGSGGSPPKKRKRRG
jgi:hypothetical protein